MRNLPKGFQRFSTDALGRRISGRQFRKAFLEVAQLAEQFVVLAIADGRCGLLEIAAVVVFDRAAQLSDSTRAVTSVSAMAASYKRATDSQSQVAKSLRMGNGSRKAHYGVRIRQDLHHDRRALSERRLRR